MKVIVTGGRTYSDRAHVFASLDLLHDLEPITHLIHGAARGADTLAGEWAASRKVACTAVPAEWELRGMVAGRMRNREMLDMEPDAVVAFPGGTGTAHMTRIAEMENVRVIRC